MGFDYTEHGTNGLVLHLGAAEATGTVTVSLINDTDRHINASIGIRVGGYAGWGGAVKIAQCFGSGDTGGGEAATIQLADLKSCINGTDGAVDTTMWGVTALIFDVTNNDRELDIFVTSCFRP